MDGHCPACDERRACVAEVAAAIAQAETTIDRGQALYDLHSRLRSSDPYTRGDA
jgi:hypothetical protein